MKKLLVGMVVLLSVVAFVNVAEAADGTAIEGVTTTVNVDVVSQYIWRGFNVYGSKGAIQPSVDFALDNGFSANLWMSYPIGSGAVDDPADGIGINDELTEYNYTLAYSGTLNEDSEMKTNYTVGWRYYDYIDIATKELDMQELFLEFSMPALVDGGIVPHAGIYKMWDSKGGGHNGPASGTIFAMGFGYDFTLEQAPELPMAFSWDIVFNDGAGDVDQDWSHMVFGLSTAMDCPATNAKIVPAVYWQKSFEDDVNENDELWAGVSFALNF